MDKQKLIKDVANSIDAGIATAMHMSQVAETDALWRRVIDPSQMEILDLAVFCEREMLRAIRAEAYFSSCVIGAAMNEALLAQMCLLFEKNVRATRQFFYSTKKLKDLVYRDVVSHWKLEQFIKVSEECGWIPTTIVEREFVDTLVEGYRELTPLTNPELSQDEIDSEANSFFQAPGPSMLRMTQKLRNAVHPGSWMRGKSTFNAEHFGTWCQFATVLSAEVRLCLLHQITMRMGELAREQASKIEDLVAKLPAEALPIWEAYMRDRLGLQSFGVEDLLRVATIMKTAYPHQE